MKENRICNTHGEFVHSYEPSNKRWRCNKCRTEAVQRRRKKLKQLAAEYKGGGCCVCGYNRCLEALDFHHIDPNEKEFGIAASGIIVSWERVKKEIEKCVLLCANCHREFHAGLIQLPK